MFNSGSLCPGLIPFSRPQHYDDVTMGSMASQITSLTLVYSTVYSDADQRKHQSYASLAFVWGIHRVPVNSPPKGPVTRKMFPFDDVIMRGDGIIGIIYLNTHIFHNKINLVFSHYVTFSFQTLFLHRFPCLIGSSCPPIPLHSNHVIQH